MIQTYLLRRTEDVSGVSGIGVVAEAAVFESGKCVVSWLVPPYSLSIHDTLDAAITVHGHGGKTEFVEKKI